MGLKFSPIILNAVPIGPDARENESTSGGLLYKNPAIVPDPPSPVTLIDPVSPKPGTA
ncbi:hypothetical protein D3C87_1028910 [compost metagenome]